MTWGSKPANGGSAGRAPGRGDKGAGKSSGLAGRDRPAKGWGGCAGGVAGRGPGKSAPATERPGKR
jgi:hypothetical protein